MSSASWPPQLKDWVAKCLGQMTDATRTEAQAELRKVISDAFNSQTLWTTDWDGVQLQSLLPKPSPSFNGLKRKSNEGNGTSPLSKKAKKSLMNRNAISTAIDPTEQAALSRRAERFHREHQLERQKQGGNGQSSFTNHLHNTHNHTHSPSPFGNPDEPEGELDWDRFAIVGTSRELFKDYLRMTSEPDPRKIRPYAVLRETLEELKKRFREKASYNWINSQFKSLRQDLTVQRIKNEFTVSVYEIHARMALEYNDMVEYNQCQSMLRTLYELGIPGKREEFTAYRILMFLHGRNRSEMNLFVGQLTSQQKSDPAVQHALRVQRASAMGNYHALFELYLNAPNMGGYIMDHFIERERVKALLVMARAYRTLPLNFLHNELAFDTIEDAREFLTTNGCAYFTNPNGPDQEKVFDCKPAAAPLTTLLEEKFRKVQIKGAI